MAEDFREEQGFITVLDEENREMRLFVIEETRLKGVNYLLAAGGEGDGEAFVLKDLSAPGETEARYVFVEDEAELDAVFRLFQELLSESGVCLEA